MSYICSSFTISQNQNWTMDEKNNKQQIETQIEEWHLCKAMLGILGIIAPTALLAFVLGHHATFLDFILNKDLSKSKVSPFYFHRWLSTLFLWPLYRLKAFKSSNKGPEKFLNPTQVWRDGSLLCTLVNMTLPGACKDPRQHWKKPPYHGMELVMKYFSIKPIFSLEKELTQNHLSPQQEKIFSKYLSQVNTIISRQLELYENMRFSTDYVARGMGLVIGEQNRKSTFYIYPIPKLNYQPCDLVVSIKGPFGYNGKIAIPSILHHQQKWQPATEYKRALYLSSKLNSISPTTQGTSFLRKLSLSTISQPKDPNLEIDIRVKISSTRAKVSYVPQKTGIYEIKLETKGCHVVGSPYTVPIELATSSSISYNSSGESDDENEEKYIKRKKKIISRIVDFIDEKMMLQEDGTLVKIDQNIETNEKSLKYNLDSNKIIDNNMIDIESKLNENIIDDKQSQRQSEPFVLAEKCNRSEQNSQSPINKKFIETEQVKIEAPRPNVLNNEHDNLETNNNDSINNITTNNDKECINLNSNEDTEENNNTINPKSLNINAQLNSNNNDSQQLNNSCFKPDILETFGIEKSAPFITKLNDEVISNTTEPLPVEPTFLTKVCDPAPTVPSDSKEIDCKNGPAKKPISLDSNENWSVRILEVHDEKFSDDTPSECGPDLVKCHIKKFHLSCNTQNKLLRQKLKKIGAISESYDEQQCFLKDCLKQNFEQYIRDKQSQHFIDEAEKSNNLKSDIVDKQKQFWHQRFSNQRINFDAPKIILKDKFSFDNDCNMDQKSSTLQNIEPLKGIVGSNIKIFENKLTSSSNKINDKYIEIKKEIQKSKSESFLLQSNENEIYQKQKAVSTEEIIKIPSIQERKNKLLQSFQQSITPAEKTAVKDIELVLKNKLTNKQGNPLGEKKQIDPVVPYNNINKFNEYQNIIENPIKIEKQYSIKRKARFKRAKLFFHYLEDSENNVKPTKLENSQSMNNIPMTDSCVFSQSTSIKPPKISDRFAVDDLFQDILGDDKRFIGIPNKTAVVASLASLDNDSNLADYYSWNEIEPNLNDFEKPKITRSKKKVVPGFFE